MISPHPLAGLTMGPLARFRWAIRRLASIGKDQDGMVVNGMAASVPAVDVQGLTKRYGAVEAVRGIDLQVHPGETFGFLGPNGAGKTTTIKILCTLADATSGSARVVGFDVRTQRNEVRRR